MDGRTKLRILYAWVFVALILVLPFAMMSAQYEFSLQTEMTQEEYAENVEEIQVSERVEYEQLTDEERAKVDRAIESGRLYFATYEEVPRMETRDAGNLAVIRDGRYYVFRRGQTLAWQTPPGIVTIVLLFSIVAGFVQIFRFQ
jgi:hypothetical protein